MNRGLTLALLLLACLIVFVGVGAMLVGRAVEEETLLLEDARALPEEEGALDELFAALERHRFLFSSLVPLRYVAEYESALGALRAAARTESEEDYADAHARASFALTQMKRSARFFPGQILSII